MNAQDYQRQLLALLPPGKAWPTDEDTVLALLLLALGDGYARVDDIAALILAERDPRHAVVTLSDWEAALGLPDPCVIASGEEQTIAQRQAGVYAKLASPAVVSRQDFIALAAQFGYSDVTIEEYGPALCDGPCDAALWTEGDRFAWQLNLPATGGTFPATCDGPCDVPLAAWGDAALECRVKQLNHCELDVLFAYV
ncbi:YmfQ family protein [Denitratisoma sp. agr-D3]